MTTRHLHESFSDWNERMASIYDPEDYHLNSGPVVRWIETRRVKTAIGLLAPRPGDRVLEVGCGAGNILERMPAGWLAGIDLSARLLGRTRQRLQQQSPALARADAERLPFRSASFDRVLCSEVLEHVLHPSEVLEEMLRVVKPDGRVVITVPNEPLINRLKGMVGALGLIRLIVRGTYHTSDRMDEEWHLHSLDLSSTLQIIPGGASVERVAAVPLAVLPLRYVLLIRPE